MSIADPVTHHLVTAVFSTFVISLDDMDVITAHTQ